MAATSAIDGQVMWVQEVTPGTYVAPTKALPFVSYSFEHVQEGMRIESQRAGWFTGPQALPGKEHVEATMSFEASSVGIGFFLNMVNGVVNTTGTNPYTHTYSGGLTNVEKAATIQFGVPNSAGTVEPFTALGCHVTKATLKDVFGQTIKLDVEVSGQTSDNNSGTQPLGSPSYPGAWTPWRSLDATLTLDGNAFEFSEFELSIDSGIETMRHAHRATNASRPRAGKVTKLREITGSFTGDYVDDVLWEAYKAQTTLTLVHTIDAGASSKLTTTATIQLDQFTPEVKFGSVTSQKVPFRVVRLAAQSEAQAFSMAHITTDTTP